jgi:hypothetical protein
MSVLEIIGSRASIIIWYRAYIINGTALVLLAAGGMV